MRPRASGCLFGPGMALAFQDDVPLKMRHGGKVYVSMILILLKGKKRGKDESVRW